MWLELKLNTSYATLSSGIPWNIPLATSILWVNKGAIRQVHTVSQLITSPKKLFACCQFTQPISLFAWTDSTKKDVLNSFIKLNEQKGQHCGHYTKQVYILFFNPLTTGLKVRANLLTVQVNWHLANWLSSKTTATDEYYTKKIQVTSGIVHVANTIMMGRLGLILLHVRYNSFPNYDFATVWYEWCNKEN